MIDIKDGSLGGWAFSMDQFEIGVVNNRPTDGSFSGLIHVPITKKSLQNYFRYTAAILPFNQYQFALNPVTNVDIDIWKAKATIAATSKIVIDYKNNDFTATAKLDGKISIDDGDSGKPTKLNAIGFSGLTLSNKAPYLNSPGTWDVPAIGASMAGFSINVSKINLAKSTTNNEIKLNFNLDVELGDGKDLSLKGGGGFAFVGQVNQAATGTQEYGFNKIGYL